jgi:hypothetical protein
MIYLCAFEGLDWLFFFLKKKCSRSKMMKHERTERLLHYVNFTEGRCGLIIEQHNQFVWHV